MNRRSFLKLLALLPFLDKLEIPELDEMYIWNDDGEVWYTIGSGSTWTALLETARIELHLYDGFHVRSCLD